MKNNWIIVLFGLSLFFLVLSVLYTMMFVFPENDVENRFQIFIPLVVFSGFFIFLIAAMLVALSLYNMMKSR